MALGMVFISHSLSAQNINSLETRLDRMEREMLTLSRSVYKGDVPPPQINAPAGDAHMAAQMENRLNQLEDQLRRLTGMIEETGYRLRQLEGKMTGSSASVTTQPVTAQPLQSADMMDAGQAATQPQPSFTVDNAPYQLGTITDTQNNQGTPAGLYDQAFSFLQSNDYASAQANFEKFIETYPDHDLAANAKYWLGETFYAREDYQAASRAFARSFKDHPDGQKAPDTLLKLAMSLKGQDMTEEACLTLGELDKRFPNAVKSIADKAASERLSYGCE